MARELGMSPRQFLAEHTSADIAEWMALNLIENGMAEPDKKVDAALHKAFGKRTKRKT